MTSRLAEALASRAGEHPGKSGIHPLADSRAAFAARVLLARAAERSLDLQYYIWHDDLSGGLLLQELREAAARGVHVRLLLDDNNTARLDGILAALDAHPNIEVRLFNPFHHRAARWLAYLVDFRRINHRMHNKSFTADGEATIVGGRNVGDAYFDAGEGSLFVDLDVLAVGPAAHEVCADFERYWTSAPAYPVDCVLERTAHTVKKKRDESAIEAYLDAVRKSDFVHELIEGRLPLDWVATRLVSDDPAKALGRAGAALLPQHMNAILGEPRSTLDIVSAYFVPAINGTRVLVDMARRGVRMRVMTNSLEATDVAIVHAGYAKRRKRLLRAGLKLYELRRLGERKRVPRSSGPGGSASSASSLHAKTFSADRARVFVGSFNFDPRSAHLNTEMGLVFESAALAREIEGAFESRIRENSYEVRLDERGRLCWIEQRDGREVRHRTEPGTTLWERAAVAVLSKLPIDWLL